MSSAALADDTAEATVIDLRTILRAVRRRRWLALSVFAVCVVAGVIYTINATRIYSATTTLVIERNAPEVLSGVHEVYDLGAGTYWSAKDYYETQYNLIHSRPVAQRVLQLLGVSPAAVIEEISKSTTGNEGEEMSPELLERIQYPLKVFGLTNIKSGATLLKIFERLDPIDIMQKRIRVLPVKDSQLVKVEIDDADPQLAARIANAVASAYSDINLSQKVDLTRTAVDWLHGQVDDLKEKLESDELALHNFKRENNIVSSSTEERETVVAQTLKELNQELSTATAKRIALESRRDQLQRVANSDVPADAVEEVLESPVVQHLKESYAKLSQELSDLSVRYTPEHPRVVAVQEQLKWVNEALRAEIGKVMRTLDDRYRTAADTERKLHEAIDATTKDALEVGRKEIEYNRLLRERDNSKNLYSLVLNRQKEAHLTQMLRVNNVRQIEPAIPASLPVRPRLRLNVAVAMIIGAILAVMASLIADFLDNTLKTQEQTEALLNLPFLGVIPIVKPDRRDQRVDDQWRDQYMLTHPRSSLAECCKTLRTNLMFMSTERPAQALLVTSSGPREGKSTTAINLAITMAQLGARTLIVDTDLRRPRVHKSWGLGNDSGISNLVLREGSLDDAIQKTSVPGLDVLTSGPIPPNPAELLHTEAFRDVVAQLRKRYDRILFDSPPVAVVTDAQVMGSLVDGVVLVVRAGKTTWPGARIARRRLMDVGAKIFGVVLNNVDLTDKRTTYYQDYAYYYPTYTPEEEASA